MAWLSPLRTWQTLAALLATSSTLMSSMCSMYRSLPTGHPYTSQPGSHRPSTTCPASLRPGGAPSGSCPDHVKHSDLVTSSRRLQCSSMSAANISRAGKRTDGFPQ